MKLACSGCAYGEVPQLVISDIPAGIPHDQSFLLFELRHYARMVSPDYHELDYRILSGVAEGKTTGEPLVCALVGCDSLIKPPSELTRFVPRPGRGDLFALLSSDDNDCAHAQAWNRSLFELEHVAAAAFARELLVAQGVTLASWTTGIGCAQLDPEKLLLSESELSEACRHPLRIAHPEFAREAEREIIRADAEGYTLGGSCALKVSGLIPAFGQRGQGSFASLVASALYAIEGVCGLQWSLDSQHLKNPLELNDALALSSEGICYESSSHAGMESYWSTGQDVYITVHLRPDMESLCPLQSFDLETGQASTVQGERIAPLRVLSGALMAESCLALALAQLYCDRFGSSSLAVINAGVQAFKDRLKAFSR